jgi:amidophosphoribosyltransferase
LLERGVGLSSTSDSEVITQMLAAPPPGGELAGPDWVGRIAAFMAEAEGAYALVILTRDAVYAVRDPWGLRPLCLGELSNNGHPGYVVASESCALATIGARVSCVKSSRERSCGWTAAGLHSVQGRGPPSGQSLCVFEYVYFARPIPCSKDRRFTGCANVWASNWPARRRSTPMSSSACPTPPPRPLSATARFPASLQRGPDQEPLHRAHLYPARRPLRSVGVHLKYNPLTANLEGKRVVLIDDSIVRGNTIGPHPGPAARGRRDRGARARLVPAHSTSLFHGRRHGDPRGAHRQQAGCPGHLRAYRRGQPFDTDRSKLHFEWM